MFRLYAMAALVWAVVAPIASTQEQSKLPQRAPPRFASIVEVRGDVVVYRDFQFTVLMPKKQGAPGPNGLSLAQPATGPVLPCAVEFPLKHGEVLDAEGKKIDGETVRKRLAPGDTVLVTMGEKVDPAYLRVIKKETLILVHPVPPPGPPARIPKGPNLDGKK